MSSAGTTDLVADDDLHESDAPSSRLAPDEPTKRPRILLVTSKLDNVGGIASYVRALHASLVEVADVEVVDLGLRPNRLDHLRAFLGTLARAVRTRPDLLLLGHVGFGPIGLVWRLLGGRYVVMAYGIDIWGPRRRGLEWTLRQANAVWPISGFTEVEVLRAGPGSRTVTPLGGCIDPSFVQEHEPVAGPARVLLVASLADLRYKGADTLVDAVLRLQDRHQVELRVVGSGPGTPALEAYIDEVGATSCVRLVGRVDHDELLAEYRHADAIVLLSRLRRGPDPQGEGLGLVVLEAAAAGVPAIASRDGGSTDTVVDGVTGYLVAPGDLDDLTNRLDELLSDPARARSLGEAGRRFVLEQHSAEVFAQRVADAVRRACG